MRGLKLKIFPDKCRHLNNFTLHTNEAGRFIFTETNKSLSEISSVEPHFLYDSGMATFEDDDLGDHAFNYEKYVRTYIPDQLAYLIIIPTLRCNLTCSYCQVSRAAEGASGFDWTNNTYELFYKFLIDNASDSIKIEIQGGEPLLVFEDLKLMFERVSKIKEHVEFVICTNLQDLPSDFFEIMELYNISISSSLDGPPKIHERNRNNDFQGTQRFMKNLNSCQSILGKDRISVLPTIPKFSEISNITEYYREIGFSEIFLRPVNFQGFARKKHKDSLDSAAAWLKSYLIELEKIFYQNNIKENKIIEINFSIHLRKIFNSKNKSYVDFRSPNPVAKDYLVINYDGSFFPSDEARMLHRIGVIDLSIGSLSAGYDCDKIATLNDASTLDRYDGCQVCAYKPFCGVDIVDHISRYGTADVDILETSFCKYHMGLFDFIFANLREPTDIFLKNVSLHLSGNYEMSDLASGRYYD